MGPSAHLPRAYRAGREQVIRRDFIRIMPREWKSLTLGLGTIDSTNSLRAGVSFVLEWRRALLLMSVVAITDSTSSSSSHCSLLSRYLGPVRKFNGGPRGRVILGRKLDFDLGTLVPDHKHQWAPLSTRCSDRGLKSTFPPPPPPSVSRSRSALPTWHCRLTSGVRLHTENCGLTYHRISILDAASVLTLKLLRWPPCT